MPATMSRSTISGLELAGPRVATILVLRMALLFARARSESAFGAHPDDGRQDLVARHHRAFHRARDFGLADSAVVAYGHFDDANRGARGLGLHLRRPAIVFVLHVE